MKGDNFYNTRACAMTADDDGDTAAVEADAPYHNHHDVVRRRNELERETDALASQTSALLSRMAEALETCGTRQEEPAATAPWRTALNADGAKDGEVARDSAAVLARLRTAQIMAEAKIADEVAAKNKAARDAAAKKAKKKGKK